MRGCWALMLTVCGLQSHDASRLTTRRLTSREEDDDVTPLVSLRESTESREHRIRFLQREQTDVSQKMSVTDRPERRTRRDERGAVAAREAQ